MKRKEGCIKPLLPAHLPNPPPDLFSTHQEGDKVEGKVWDPLRNPCEAPSLRTMWGGK